jgi:hypothetical protein
MGIDKCLRGLSAMSVTKRQNGEVRAVNRTVLNYMIGRILVIIIIVSNRGETGRKFFDSSTVQGNFELFIIFSNENHNESDLIIINNHL